MADFQTAFAKKLRSNMTEAESKLWYFLRAHRFQHTKFRRQQPIGEYIVDFISFDYKLIVEVDGGLHLENQNDRVRDEWLKARGYTIMRFWNNQVLNETDQVLEEILRVISDFHPLPSPSPRQGGGELKPAIAISSPFFTFG